MTATYNAREELEKVTTWLGLHTESLSFGLRSMFDALALYHGWMANSELPELCDGDYGDDGTDLALTRKSILGYDPLGIAN